LIIQHWASCCHQASPEWPKDIATTDAFFQDIAATPAILAALAPVLGPDIVLWGASVIFRESGQDHPIHTDIESSDPSGGFASVWIGLENTCKASSLQLLTHSHLLGKSLQQARHERGLKRGEAGTEQILSWVRETQPDAALVQHDTSDGDALIFDGRLWHGSDNTSGHPRKALLLQYARADKKVPVQNFGCVDWPFTFTERSAPLIGVSGAVRDVRPENGLCRLPLLGTTIGRDRERVPDAEGWKPYPILRGRTANLSLMQSHASVLSPGCSPHPPHCHVEEELLVVLDGEAEIVIADSAEDPAPRVETMRTGDFAYYPAYQYHTIRNASGAPVKYQMFRWQGILRGTWERMKTAIHRSHFDGPSQAADQMRMGLIFEAPTAFLRKLHAHVTTMPAGAGYPAHEDEHDVAIMVFGGTVEADGFPLAPGESVYHPAGVHHGLRNTSSQPASYLVFEFHG
jgi:mannose-6-phosphate isomerase-like protein (cupin superfamily)